MGRNLPWGALARNRGVRKWLWRLIVRHESHSKFKRLLSNSDGRYTSYSCRALRRERVGPRELPAVGGASRARVVFIHRLSIAIALNHMLWRLSHSEKYFRVKSRLSFFFLAFFVVFSLRLNGLFFAKNESLFVLVFFLFYLVVFLPPLGPALSDEILEQLAAVVHNVFSSFCCLSL